MAILTLKVKGQTLTVESEIDRIVENSVNYLDFEIICNDENWRDLSKKVIVTYDKKAWEAFMIIPPETIHSPGFTISVIGSRKPGTNSDDDLGEIVTTYPVAVKVFPSGATNGSDPEDTAIDFSTADELNAKIENQVNEIKNNYLSKDLLKNLINENSTNLEVPTAKAVYDCVEALKTEVMDDLDKLGDLIDDATKEYVTLVETSDYAFEKNDTFEDLCSVSLNNITDISMLKEGVVCKVTVGDTVNDITIVKNVNGYLIIGNLSLVGMGDDTGETYIITIEEGFPTILYRATEGTYKVGILVESEGTGGADINLLDRVNSDEKKENDVYNAIAIDKTFKAFNDIITDIYEKLGTLNEDYVQALSLIGGTNSSDDREYITLVETADYTFRPTEFEGICYAQLNIDGDIDAFKVGSVCKITGDITDECIIRGGLDNEGYCGSITLAGVDDEEEFADKSYLIVREDSYLTLYYRASVDTYKVGLSCKAVTV